MSAKQVFISDLAFLMQKTPHTPHVKRNQQLSSVSWLLCRISDHLKLWCTRLRPVHAFYEHNSSPDDDEELCWSELSLIVPLRAMKSRHFAQGDLCIYTTVGLGSHQWDLPLLSLGSGRVRNLKR